MTNSELNKAIRKIKAAREFSRKILENPKSTEDERDDANCIEDVITKMCRYTDAVFDDNYKKVTRVQMERESSDVDNYRYAYEQIEKNRKMAHDDLITALKQADMVCRENGLEEIYGLPEEYKRDTSGLMGSENRNKPGVVEVRHGIAKWTWDIVMGCTVAIILEMDNIDYDKNLADMDEVSEAYKFIQRKKGIKNMMDEMTK